MAASLAMSASARRRLRTRFPRRRRGRAPPATRAIPPFAPRVEELRASCVAHGSKSSLVGARGRASVDLIRRPAGSGSVRVSPRRRGAEPACRRQRRTELTLGRILLNMGAALCLLPSRRVPASRTTDAAPRSGPSLGRSRRRAHRAVGRGGARRAVRPVRPNRVRPGASACCATRRLPRTPSRRRSSPSGAALRGSSPSARRRAPGS